MMYFITSVVQQDPNRCILVRDSCPRIRLDVCSKSERTISSHEKIVLEACKSFFEDKHHPTQAFTVQYNQPECKLAHIIKQTQSCFIPVSFQIKAHAEKGGALITTRLRKIFEHAIIHPKPHQRKFREKLWMSTKDTVFHTEKQRDERIHESYLLFWSMGSGKTIGSLELFSYHHIPRVIVLCLNTTIGQWVRFISRMPQPDNSQTEFDIIGLTEFGRIVMEDNPMFLKNRFVIFDEAHFFRNITPTMRAQIEALRKSRLLLNLTGTPLVNSLSDIIPLIMLHHGEFRPKELEAIKDLAENSEDEAKKEHVLNNVRDMIQRVFRNHVHFYDPKKDSLAAGDYAPFETQSVRVEMTWPQTVDYMVHKRQNFDIGDLCITGSHRNSYHVQERLISNGSDATMGGEHSPKLDALVENVFRFGRFPQLIFSGFLEKGVHDLLKKCQGHSSGKELVIEMITGKTPNLDRDDVFTRYNAGKIDILILSRVGDTAVDLHGTLAVHLCEAQDNIQSEMQIINRALRCGAHKKEADGKIKPVQVFKYVSTFPAKRKNSPETTEVAAYFYKRYCNSKMGTQHDFLGGFCFMDALCNKIEREEEWKTIDERLEVSNAHKHRTLLPVLSMLEQLGSC